jgi:hypothetical protein
MSRAWSRRGLLAAGVIVVVGGPTAVVLAADNGPSDSSDSTDPSQGTPTSSDDPPASTESASRRTAEIERRDLVRTYDASGTIGYGERTPLRIETGGTITDLPAVGSTIDVGAPVCEIDGAPGPILLVGQRPMWRDVRAGVDDGTDIAQLELDLVLLGHADAAVMAVDGEWDAETTAAVKRWQESLGRDETGRVSRTDVWFRPTGAVRVSSRTAAIGDEARGEVLQVTGVDRWVLLDLDADRADLVEVDADVDVELVDGTIVTGTVVDVADVATVPTDPSQSATVAVRISVGASVDAPDESPVTIHLVADARRDVLAVPVEAVVALSEGGYALEIANGGSTQLVGVELGRFADGWVEVDGEIEAGQTVVTA